MELSERLARHEATVQSKIAEGIGFNLPSHDELRGEAEYLSGRKGPQLDAAVAAEERYIGVLRQLVEARRDADRQWRALETDPGDLEHRQGGLAALDELLPDLDGAASEEYLLRAAANNTDAAILYAYRFLIYGLVKLDADRFEWWDRKSDDERLSEALDLFEAFADAEPEKCLRALTKDVPIAELVVDAMRAEEPLEALRADLL